MDGVQKALNGTVPPPFDPRCFHRRIEVYALPPAAAEVIRLTQSSEVDADDVAAAVEKDPGLALRLVQMSNCSLFARLEQICSVGEAVRFLGFRAVRLAAVSLLLKALRDDDNGDPRQEAYWRHALTVSVAARHLSRAKRVWHPDEAFLAALLMDIAVPVILKMDLPCYERMLGPDRGHPDPLEEGDCLGAHHGDLAADCLEKWGIPDHVVAAVRGHHFPETVVTPPEARPFAVLLEMAHGLADCLCRGEEGVSDMAARVGRFWCGELGFLPEELGPFLDHLTEEVAAASAVFELDVDVSPDWAALAAHDFPPPSVAST
ncbi:MAG TPA: HDOD domain-containing protein [Planctomycetes bacterium]|nr:HDOD domain-containing protein [Planctomycetota bacterium]